MNKKYKVLKISLCLFALISLILPARSFSQLPNNIFQYILTNINHIYLKNDPIRNDVANEIENYIDTKKYVDNYIDENNAITNIYFKTSQNIAIDYGDEFEFEKITTKYTFEIKQTTKLDDNEISIVISSINKLPITFFNNVILVETRYNNYYFYVTVDFNNHALSTNDKIHLYNLWFENFKQLILEKAYNPIYNFSYKNWGFFSPFCINDKKYLLNETIFDLSKKIDYNTSNVYPRVYKIEQSHPYIYDDFNDNSNLFIPI